MKKIILAGLLISASFSASALIPVFDAEAIVNLGLQLSQLRDHTTYLKQELERLKEGQFKWSDAQSLINDLGAAVNKTNTLAYSAADVEDKFQKAYPGYKAPQNYSKQYQENINMTQQTLNGVLVSMGTSAKDFESENTRLKFLQQQAQKSEGQVQAIQASAQIASEIVSQLQLLRQTMIAQTNAQTAYYATSIQTQASAQAELAAALSNGSTDIPKYGSSGHYLTTPNFDVYNKK